MRLQTVSLAVPELILITVATLVIVGGAFWRSRTGWTVVSILALVASVLTLVPLAPSFQHRPYELVDGPFLVDSLGVAGRFVALFVGILLMLVLARRQERLSGGELPGMVLMLSAGLSLCSWAGNAILLFLSLELTSIPTYVLLFIGRADRNSAEATIKYFMLSVLSSAMFLMGLAMLFGVTGTLDFSQLAEYCRRTATPSAPLSLSLAWGFIFFGLGFKLAVVPLHFYAPDVYQATTNAIAGLLAVVPKLAGTVVLVRFLSLGELALGWQAIAVIAMISMTLGNLSALCQKNVRRMLAYSSIAHAGYLLIGIAVAMSLPAPTAARGPFNGVAATLIYALVYVAATLGAFAVLAELSRDEREASTLDDLKGLIWRRPVLAGALAICMFSLTGIPPLAGFWGKFELIGSALQIAGQSAASRQGSWFLVLAVVAMVNAAIAAAYYLRVIAMAFFYRDDSDRPGSAVLSRSPAAATADPIPSHQVASSPFGAAGMAATVAALSLVIVGIIPGPMVSGARRIGHTIDVPRPAAVNASSKLPLNRPPIES